RPLPYETTAPLLFCTALAQPFPQFAAARCVVDGAVGDHAARVLPQDRLARRIELRMQQRVVIFEGNAHLRAVRRGVGRDDVAVTVRWRTSPEDPAGEVRRRVLALAGRRRARAADPCAIEGDRVSSWRPL